MNPNIFSCLLRTFCKNIVWLTLDTVASLCRHCGCLAQLILLWCSKWWDAPATASPGAPSSPSPGAPSSPPPGAPSTPPPGTASATASRSRSTARRWRAACRTGWAPGGWCPPSPLRWNNGNGLSRIDDGSQLPINLNTQRNEVLELTQWTLALQIYLNNSQPKWEIAWTWLIIWLDIMINNLICSSQMFTKDKQQARTKL